MLNLYASLPLQTKLRPERVWNRGSSDRRHGGLVRDRHLVGYYGYLYPGRIRRRVAPVFAGRRG